MNSASLRLAEASAVLFDLDGVLTPTAEVHMRAWRDTFAPLFERLGVAPYTDDDYFRELDGRPRYDGVAGLLASRGIELPWGEISDPPDASTVCGIGNRKNAEFTRILVHEGVAPYAGSVALLDDLATRGVPLAVVSSSKNAHEVLRAAGLADRFAFVIDGVLAAVEALPGKPAPDTFLHAAAALGVPPARTAVIEDAIGGVAAARAGGFGLVVGVDRGAGTAALLAAGATIVVRDLRELIPSGRGRIDP